MAFLDNSGDIILDAVLTDAGRQRLAKGDGSFKITKFALGDDEINYELYNTSAETAFKDLEIMQSPVLEAFTNNTSVMKSRLITIPRNDILYLPVILKNENEGQKTSEVTGLNNTIPIAADGSGTGTTAATLGDNAYDAASSTGFAIVVDQGLNTDSLNASNDIPPDLYEDSYSVQLDNRLLLLADGGETQDASFIDDDNIALYNISTPSNMIEDKSGDTDTKNAISGPRGSRLKLGLRSSLDIQNSDYLFTRLGGETTVSGVDYYYIDTNMRITGLTTGYRVDLPLRILRLKSL
tara:strand:+ start:37954 stop:38838 length:885 start_codon:yes stop_codon:yes gene_type:complete